MFKVIRVENILVRISYCEKYRVGVAYKKGVMR